MMTHFAMLSVTLHDDRLCPVESDSTWDRLCHVECDTTWWQTMPCWVWQYMMTDYAMLSVTVHDDRLCHVESDMTWWQTMPCWVWQDMMTDCVMLSVPCWVGKECAMLSLCWLLFWCSFHHSVTVAARKKNPVILPKVQVAGYSYISMHLMYVALHEVTWCMVVRCTQNALRQQQFHVAPAMPAL